MGRQKMTDAEKAAKASGPAAVRVTLDDKVAAVQAQANAGDEGAEALLPVISVYVEQVKQAEIDLKAGKRKLRKILNAISQ
jgi:hypothetical protein